MMQSLENLAGHPPAVKAGGRRVRRNSESHFSISKSHTQDKTENPNRIHHELDVDWENDKEPKVDYEMIKREENLHRLKHSKNQQSPHLNYQRQGNMRKNTIQQPMKGMLAI